MLDQTDYALLIDGKVIETENPAAEETLASNRATERPSDATPY